MDLKLNYIDLKKEDLNLSCVPDKIWINMWGINTLLNEDMNNLVEIFAKFDKAEILIQNLGKKGRKQIQEEFFGIKRIRILKR